MKRAGGGFDPAYNAQTAADEAANIIVAAELDNVAPDANWLLLMIQAVEDKLGVLPELGLAGAGYGSEENLKKARIELVVARGREGKGHAEACTGCTEWKLACMALNQRMVAQYAGGDSGGRELHLFYQDKEISFDEPELFAFGETLARQTRFAAGEALGWSQPGDWPRVAGLLQQLLEEGVLRRADEGDIDDCVFGEAGAQPSPLQPAQTSRTRSWHESPALVAELTGRPLDIGYLELVVPVFRVAHMSVDAEGRQVGESNAFPAVLRLDVATRWRTCLYGGSRYLDSKPMNVCAVRTGAWAAGGPNARWQPS